MKKNLVRFNKIILIYVILLPITVASAFMFINYGSTKSKNNDDCLICHEDKELKTKRNGKEVSLFVNKAEFNKSVHGGNECTDCHVGYNSETVPHTTGSSQVDCKSCHTDVKMSDNSAHKKQQCSACHGSHNIQHVKTITKDNTTFCLNCHQSKSISSFLQSKHSKNGLNCKDCHNSGHSTIRVLKNEITQLCGKCHQQSLKDFNNSIHHITLTKNRVNTPTCVDCHGSHNVYSSKLTIESKACLKCHLNEKLFPGEEKGSANFVAKYKTSIHTMIQKNGLPAAGCVDCHGNHMIENLSDPQASTHKSKMVETCGKCHSDIFDEFKNSAHYREYLKQNSNAPLCFNCHGEHSINAVALSDEFSRLNQSDICLGCHNPNKVKSDKEDKIHIANYKESVHYIALKNGNSKSATCSNCHGAHSMKKASDSTSSISKYNIHKTCGQSECHEKQREEFVGSVHYNSIFSKVGSDAPTCNDCHGNHQILKKDDKGNLISTGSGIVQLCSDCHSSVKLTQKYNLPEGVVRTYKESFHGLAIRGGSKVAANCESCHGNHNIRPSDDTLSTINARNLPKTCGNCHKGVDESFFKAKIHLSDPAKQSPWVFWISRIYILLIVIIIGGMVLHNILDFRKKKLEMKTKH